jgi:DNA-binding HxlR family transcriptional regulator
VTLLDSSRELSYHANPVGRTTTVSQRDTFDDDMPPVGQCSVVGALQAIGDSWSFLVLRELFFGVRRFNDIQRDLDISRSVLTDRLARLVALGVVRTEPYQEPGDRVRSQYRLTRKGVALLPAIVALKEWGDEYLFDGDPPITLYERSTGEPVRLEFRSSSGRRVEPNEMSPEPS